MEINKLLTTLNYNERTSREIKYLVIHYVGALGGAQANCKYYANNFVGASAHYFVGHDGEIWQSVRDKDIAWHCGAKAYTHPACRNSNSIGIEMCVRKHDTAHLGAEDKDWYFEAATVSATLQLTRELMAAYNIPLSNVLRHYDVTGKCCGNPYVIDADMWDKFKEALEADDGEPSKLTRIEGPAVATAEQMAAYLAEKNPDAAPYALEHARLYLQDGELEGIRGDVAWAQRCLETGNDTYKGSAVTPDQYNYGGFGVTKKGEKGESFQDDFAGILVHIQHLKAYANEDPLISPCVDPRFGYVHRGCSPYVDWLGQQENPANTGKPKKDWVGWAAGKNYGSKILDILERILQMPAPDVSAPEEKLPAAPKEDPIPEPDPEDGEAAKGSYLIKTTVPCLMIRKGPGINYPITGKIEEPAENKKKYTIVEEKNGWGRLKSGAGWIYLWYTRRAG